MYVFIENRLKKLEGKDGKLTSKDMLSALSEARDDHLATSNINQSSFVNEYADDWEESDKRRERVAAAGMTCCCGCWGGGRGYLRVGQRRREFNMEEYTCLVDCDELESRHDRNDKETNNNKHIDLFSTSEQNSHYGFDDNFVAD